MFDLAKVARSHPAGGRQLRLPLRSRQDRPEHVALLYRQLRPGAAACGARRRHRRMKARRSTMWGIATAMSRARPHFTQGTEPLLNSEYAGLGAEGGDKDISYTFKFLTTELRRHAKICGYVYTELTDIEWEHNGLAQLRPHGQRVRLRRFLPRHERRRPERRGLRRPGLRALPDACAGRNVVALPSSSPIGIGATERSPAVLAGHVPGRFGESICVDEGQRDDPAGAVRCNGCGRIEVTAQTKSAC